MDTPQDKECYRCSNGGKTEQFDCDVCSGTGRTPTEPEERAATYQDKLQMAKKADELFGRPYLGVEPTPAGSDWLTDCLQELVDTSWRDRWDHSILAETVVHIAQARDAINAHILELIGEDEVRPSEGPKRNGIDQGLRRTRNRLRAEQRKRLHTPTQVKKDKK